jgi:hypothetical protein
MEWRTALSEEIQYMTEKNNSKFRGGYTNSAIRDHEVESKRIEKYMNDKLGELYSIEIKKLEQELEARNQQFRNILLALPYIKEGIQLILAKYPPVFDIIKAGSMKSSGFPGISTIRSSISGCMLTDLYLIISKCLNSIKSKIKSAEDLASADKIYSKSTSLDDKSIYKMISDHVLKRAVALHYIHQRNEFYRILMDGIRHEFLPEEKVAGGLEIYKKTGTRFLHVFIDPGVDKEMSDTITPENYGEWTSDEIYRLKHSTIHQTRITERINILCEEELKRQEQDIIDALLKAKNAENSYLDDYRRLSSFVLL